MPQHRDMDDDPPNLKAISFPRPPLRIITVVLVAVPILVLLWTSFYTVAAESEGVVLRFGKFLKTVEPGLHFKLPLGIDRVSVLPTRRQLKLEFGFYTSGYSNPDQVSQEQTEEKSMVTGDLNAALVEWVVQYRIDDPKEYLFDVRNPGQTLRDLSEAAMREVIYQPLPAPGPGPLPLESRPLDEFVLDRPYLLADTIVPLPVLNSVFAGGRLDGQRVPLP